ncbi:MAG: MarR family transcriptional regulator [Phycisphaerales bacterium]|nr:MarR family transcriptional regulator [Phycisphaerales bacterium]
MHALSAIEEKFVLHWGEMGTRWGVNRTVAQIHALLYLSERPLNAEDIATTLAVARSNVSTSLKELQSWGIVRVVHVMGDRRDHFESLVDVWQMFLIILDERKRREIDPTLRVLRECLAESGKSDAHARERIAAMLGFFETMSTWYHQFRRLPQAAMIKFFKLGSRAGKALGITT